jgi:glyceraldehyde-3-phosphate dehydrogenase/erythrose-4-phosphate dehydrogenase
LYIDGHAIHLQRENEPSKIKWKDGGVDIVIESTGFFTTLEQ